MDLDNIYNNIVESFDGNIGNCVLLLGPELAVDNKGKRHKDYFKDLSEQHPQTIEKYFEEENLFAFKEGENFRHISREIKSFYKNVGDSILLEKIARIKFPLIINFSPDLALNKVYKENDVDFVEDHFSRSTVTNNRLEKPTKDKPVVYNIFGSIEADGSLILHHGHMHKALEKLLAERALPDNIEAYLQNANTYIFLGFNYESWYYQLLCHRLYIKTPERYSILSTPDCRHNEYTNRIMGKHFRMDFTGESPKMTIERIIKTCEDSTMPNSSVLRDTKMGSRYSLVFSYAWKDQEGVDTIHREHIVDWLEQRIIENDRCSYDVYRDKKDLSFGDNIKEFMDALSTCKTIIQVISEKYIKSRNCMYEAMKIHEEIKSSDVEVKSERRVYRVLVLEKEDEGFDHRIMEDYIEYWKDQYEKGKSEIEAKENDAVQRAKAMKDLDPILEIIEFVPVLFKDLHDNIYLSVKLSDLEKHEEGIIRPTKAKEKELKDFIGELENDSSTD